MPESDMQPSPIADTAMPEVPSTRVGSFSTLLMFCHLTEFLTPLALVLSHRSRKIHRVARSCRCHVIPPPCMRQDPLDLATANSVSQCPLWVKSGHWGRRD